MNSNEYADHDSDTDEDRTARTRPSALLFLSGVAALIISASALVGPTAVEALGNVQFRWLFVVVAVVVGLALLLGPSTFGKRD